MKITKIAHSCLLIEEKGLRILTDPGIFSKTAERIKNIDLILITHADMDHLDINTIKGILRNNPKARIITNTSVSNLLKKENINSKIVEDNQKIIENNVFIEGFGKKHEVIYETIPVQDNTGYLIANRLFFPGDALTVPNKKVEILALVVSAPWLKFSEAVEYTKTINPKIVIPVHDGILAPNFNFASRMFPKVLENTQIKFLPMELEKEVDLN